MVSRTYRRRFAIQQVQPKPMFVRAAKPIKGAPPIALIEKDPYRVAYCSVADMFEELKRLVRCSGIGRAH
jgi:hypothetical protein